jgi:hypothetical protein
LELDPANNYVGCRFHRGKPQLWSTGNPRNSKEFKDFLKRYMDSKSGYIANGDTALTPNQLRQIRQTLLNSNSPSDFCMYVMILLGCRLFLREDEIADLAYDSFNHDLLVVKERDKVAGISITVQGKTDKAPVKLMIWVDDEFPEFCPVRHLMAWIGMSNITSGFLFPSADKINEMFRNKQGVQTSWIIKATERVKYNTFLAN